MMEITIGPSDSIGFGVSLCFEVKGALTFPEAMAFAETLAATFGDTHDRTPEA